MKATKIFKGIALSALLVAGTTGAALAQDQLVSGIPYDGYLQGALIQANGPVVTDEVATEAPSRLVKVEGRSISTGELSNTELAALLPEAFIGVPVEGQAADTAIAQAN
ncbi:MAG: hypothetical protein ACE5JS_15455 [Nitrospinota bacterium]